MQVSYSLASPAYVKQRLIDCYELPINTEVVILHQGINDSYYVSTDQERYVLRIYRHQWKPMQDVAGELSFIRSLDDHQIAVAYPIADQEGNWIQSLDFPEGTRYMVLFSHAPGQPISRLESHTAGLYGESLARIHQVSEKLTIPGLSKNYEPAAVFASTRSSLINRLGREYVWLDGLMPIERSLTSLLSDEVLITLTQGICHGDPHHENCYLETQSGVLTFFDFDFCGPGYLHYDLGSFFRYERDRPEIKDSFLEGYVRIRPMSEVQIKLIPYFEVLMRVFHLGARTAHEDGQAKPLWPEREIERTLREIGEQVAGLDS